MDRKIITRGNLKMCGIAGIFTPKGGTIQFAKIEHMLNMMDHRGPDSEQFYKSDNNSFQAGFKRLAIIDLKNGDQPFIDKIGRKVLFGNGEIYNFIELKDKPQTSNYSFRSQSDMEVILPLHTHYGQDFVDHLNGMFALALYEEKHHRLTLIRDRLGIKQLYWAKTNNGGIVFASEIKPLLASGLIPSAINENAVNSYLTHGYVPAPETVFKNINKLPPGHRLIAEANGEIKVQRYWRARPSDNIPSKVAEIEEYLTHLLTDSLRMQLRSDVPLGALLSGGIDSGLMVSIASGLINKPIETYTVHFEGSSIDETPLAAMVSEKFSTNHHVLHLPVSEANDHLLSLAWYIEEPLNDAALLPNFMINQELGKDLKVALNGTGGDEIFAGYNRYFQMPVERYYMSIPAHLRNIAKKWVSPMRSWQLNRAELFDGNRGQYVHDHTTFFPHPMRNLIGNYQAIPQPIQSKSFSEFEGNAQTGALIADIESYLPEDLLLLLDRSSMASSVEGRVPFLDHRLVEAALAVPPEIRSPNNKPKALERKIASRFLPDPVLKAPKHGFASPVSSWMQTVLGTASKRLLSRKESLDRGWWSQNGIDALFGNPDRHAFRIYALVMLELSVRLLVEQPLKEKPPKIKLEEFA